MPSVHTPDPVEFEQESPPDALDPSLDMNEKSGWVRKVIVLIVILTAVGFTAWKIRSNLSAPAAPTTGKHSGGGSGGDRSVPITTASVKKQTMPIYLTGLGTVTAYNSVTIKSRVDGQLIAVYVKEGQKVHKGQLLAEIDPAPYAAALSQAEGQLAKDKAAAAYANVQVERYTTLYNAGVVSQDSQQTQIANAGQIAGALQADNAAIQAAKVNLNYTHIKSPIDGVVGLRQVDPGNIVHAADAGGLLLVTQLQPISVIFTLPEDELPRVQKPMLKGTKLAVEAYDRSQTTLLATGKLLTLDNQIDTATGTDKVKAVFDNKDSELFPNQFVNVRLILEQRPDALVIPAAAIQTGSQGTFVYVLKKGDPPTKGDKSDASGSGSSGDSGGGHHHHNKSADANATSPTPATRVIEASVSDAAGSGDKDKEKFYVEIRPIVIDVTEGSQVIVTSGLSAGDEIVIDGTEKLKNGSKVSPKKESGRSGGHKSKGGDGSAKVADAPPDANPSKSDKANTAESDSGKKHHHHDKSAGEAAAATEVSPVSSEHHHHNHGQSQ